MIEAIQAAGLDPATGVAGSAATGFQPQASATEVGNFAQAQQRAADASQTQQTAGANAVSGASQAEPSQASQMFASAFDSLNSGAKKIESLSNAMSGTTGDINPSQMLELVRSTHEFMFQSQLTSNVANRTSDGVQQLFRQQS